MPRVAASGASGMGMVNLVVGVERGVIDREEARQQALRMVRFLDQKAEKFHGAFPHWIHPDTGKAKPFTEFDDGADLVETAFVAQGLLCLRQAFRGRDPVEVEIRATADRLWKGIEWDWFLRADRKTLNWHWSPNFGWKKSMPIRGFNEAAIVYLLAAASPTHGIPADAYVEGWRKSGRYINERVTDGIPLVLGRDHGGPLFFAHYSYMGFDPRRLAVGGRSYFDQFRRFCLVQREYARSRANTYKGYDRMWGLTAAFGPDGYAAFEPGEKDNGTIAPTAALSSMPYAPREVMECLKTMYYDHGGQLWQEFGFVDSFNMSRDWIAPRYLGIDSGPVAPMIENFRSGGLWQMFMKAPEIQKVLEELKAVDPQLVVPHGS